LALVQASGLLESIREEVIDQSATIGRSASDSAYVSVASKTLNLKAICTVRREGRSEPVIGTFSVDDAKRAGLWQKPGPWTDYPNRMLTMRARAFALRDAFPDVLAGLYIREEFVGKESAAAKPERNQLNDDAEWHAASAHGAHDPIPNNADAQSNEPHHVADNAKEREQVITSGHNLTPETHGERSRADRVRDQVITSRYGFTPETNGQKSPADRVRDQAKTSGYGFTPETNGVSDRHDGSQSLLARRRAPPPPPEGESDAANVPIGATPTFAEPEGSIELASHVESDQLNIKSDGEVKNFLLADRRAISATGDEGADHNTDESSYGSVDPETLLDLLDSALCCALDRLTFQEIEDDFAERLKSLSKDHRKRAQKIIDRHHKRVEDLDRSTDLQNDNQNADDMMTPKLPRRLETALTHLGIGRSPSRDRRSRRKERPSQSLSSWNARHRLTSHELSDGKGVDNRDGINPSEAQPEAGE